MRDNKEQKNNSDKDVIEFARAEARLVAERARQIANRIRDIIDQVISAFKFAEPHKRQGFMLAVTNDITLDMAPVISWIERKRSPAQAQLVIQRVYTVLEEAYQCAQLDIPEYAGGVRGHIPHDCSPGVHRNATNLVTATLVAASLHDWANEIEAEAIAADTGQEIDKYAIRRVGDT